MAAVFFIRETYLPPHGFVNVAAVSGLIILCREAFGTSRRQFLLSFQRLPRSVRLQFPSLRVRVSLTG